MEKLQTEAQSIRTDLQIIKAKRENSLEKLVESFEEKVLLWKKKMFDIETQYEQLMKRLRDQVETAKKEIERELLEQRAEREQNKEKLLTLLETNV